MKISARTSRLLMYGKKTIAQVGSGDDKLMTVTSITLDRHEMAALAYHIINVIGIEIEAFVPGDQRQIANEAFGRSMDALTWFCERRGEVPVSELGATKKPLNGEMLE